VVIPVIDLSVCGAEKLLCSYLDFCKSVDLLFLEQYKKQIKNVFL